MAADVAVAGQCPCRWCGGGAAMRAPAERRDQAPHMVRRARRQWPGSGGPASPYAESDRRSCQSRRSRPVIYVPSAPDFLISIFVGIWVAVALVESGAAAAEPARGVCAARPLPSVSGRTSSRGFRCGSKRRQRGRRTELMICDEVPGATVLGFQRPCIAHSVGARRSADGRRARSGDSSRARARAAARRLGAARADAVAVGAVDPSGRAVRVARAESRARDGVRRVGRCADRLAEGVRAMSRARRRGARADERRPDAGARAHSAAGTISCGASIACWP